MAFQIIRHAFSMIFGNLGQALRVSVGPYALLVAVIVVSVLAFGAPVPGFAPTEPIGPGSALIVLFVLLVTLFIFGWIAVSWHRFILLEEYSGALPAIADRPIWPYVGRSALYAVMLVLIALPLFFVLGLIVSSFTSDAATIGGSFVIMIASAILTFIWFRIALALPSVAVGKPITMAQAWAASSGLSGTIFGVAFLMILINSVSSLFIGQISLVVPIIGAALDLALQWVLLMLGVSILTTLYGHLIEKRPLI